MAQPYYLYIKRDNRFEVLRYVNKLWKKQQTAKLTYYRKLSLDLAALHQLGTCSPNGIRSELHPQGVRIRPAAAAHPKPRPTSRQ